MNKAIFLDRDGVINEVLSDRVKFVNHPSQLYLLEGAAKAVRLLYDKGFTIFVVTNQGGVGLGYLKEEMLQRIHQKMIGEIEKEGGRIQEVAYCAHAPYAGCSCRKPGPGMITALASKHGINLEHSYMIGDRDVDILAGKAACVKTILIGSEDHGADYRFDTLFEAAVWILKEENLV
ncbi:D-glycero-alpha-D-manno-heptose-1,7-bisphosphate 7-phosphatase [Peribacillus frigoritolerans]|uniref:D-glycero-alpha-D-manno-heptose-1,7-bisphosphate 7-phosphatase n=1 Tax=Peribacillus frigoritolerans TaxID=450367 RepID=UPI001059621D|nr:HAD family hydrolase [Peribacillus frigoritolerans]TDL80266.1 HAD family hydrolase [Peribacillus frigoritolerans]